MALLPAYAYDCGGSLDPFSYFLGEKDLTYAVATTRRPPSDSKPKPGAVGHLGGRCPGRREPLRWRDARFGCNILFQGRGQRETDSHRNGNCAGRRVGGGLYQRRPGLFCRRRMVCSRWVL